MSRAFRARPLDVSKQLDLVLDINELDSTEGLPARDVVHNHAQLDADNEKPKMIQQPGNAGIKEIPIPGIIRIPSYQTDYLPVRRERNTYLRPKGGVGYDDPILVEYDLDSEDEKWLKQYNGSEPERLSEEKFEMMLWRLEITNAAATDRVLTLSGAAPAERTSVAACATTDHMPREEALQMLEETCSARDTIRADVYAYWVARRKALGRPLMRRLIAPTPINDQNPYNVFRPRERIHRPQTRRRRENNADSLEKLRMVRENVLKALDIFEGLVKRERKKRDLVYVETDMQQLQIKHRHEPRAAVEQIEAEYAAAARGKNPKRPIGFDRLPEAAPPTTNILLDFKTKKNKKRKKFGEMPMLHAVSHLPPPPVGAQPGLPFAAQPPNLAALSLYDDMGQPAEVSKHARLPAQQAADGSWWQPRIGRGGRLVFDRCPALDPSWGEPGTPEQQDAAAEQQQQQQQAGGEQQQQADGGKGGGSKKKRGDDKGREEDDKAAAADGKEAEAAAAEAEATTPAPAVKQEPQQVGSPATNGQAGGGGAPDGGAAAAGGWSWDKPLWEQPNPYGQWLNKPDLASAALTRLAGTPAALAANPPTTVRKHRPRASPGADGDAGSPQQGSASAATPGGAAAAAGTPTTTAASKPGAGGAAGTAGRPPLPPAAAAAAGGGSKTTPGTAGSARRDARRPPKTTAGQKSNLGPGGGPNGAS
ncbi:enhancer of polycomb 1 [Micractinium conductrix]|uniref:Enhancer of polycomb-like protein n=1 Tax=Micractinium conductrix TaxID=554055 RepID=A0A2P6V375_9CHLO|nr:enhancer of polycomb 1 [Micractinium conductrix]|eukprot:PSC68541.1 enhancer of polycomb 1 [Micractinium conductrix]